MFLRQRVTACYNFTNRMLSDVTVIAAVRLAVESRRVFHLTRLEVDNGDGTKRR